MTHRKGLLATAILMFPIAVEAQPPSEPVMGFYLGAAGGFNIKTNPNINNIQSDLPGAGGLITPNANLSTGIGGAGVGALGYGLGNGLRIEIEGAFRGNSFSRTSGNNRSGVNASTGTSGSEQLYGPMVNLDYDFNGLVPWLVPYVGLGLGYQWAHLNNFSTTGTAAAGALAPTIRSNDTRGGFAVQAFWEQRMKFRRCRAWLLPASIGLWRCRGPVPTMRALPPTRQPVQLLALANSSWDTISTIRFCLVSATTSEHRRQRLVRRQHRLPPRHRLRPVRTCLL